MWHSRSSHSLLVGIQTGMVLLKESLAVYYKSKGTLEEDMVTHSSILPWRIPRTKCWRPGGQPSIGFQSVGNDKSSLACTQRSSYHTTQQSHTLVLIQISLKFMCTQTSQQILISTLVIIAKTWKQPKCVDE